MNEQIVVCMPLKNAEKTVESAIQSFCHQRGMKRNPILLIGIDNSTDHSLKVIQKYLSNPNIILLNVNFENTHSNRNFLNDYARNNIPNCVLIGRLDADDTIANEYTLAKIESEFDKTNFDVLICGNKQSKNREVLEWENKPSKNLLNKEYLIEQLKEMSLGNPKAEIPSCNIFITPHVKVDYPAVRSAEDHWLVAYLLLLKDEYNVTINEQMLYSIYSLDGLETSKNRTEHRYISSREKMYRFFSYLTDNPKDDSYPEWNKYIQSNGLDFHIKNIKENKQKLKKYWDSTYPIKLELAEQLKLHPSSKEELQLLDIGCGPFPKSGAFHKAHKVHRTLIDAIGDRYIALLQDNGIQLSENAILKGNVESINKNFSSKSFDIIFCKNALDHTYNPIKGLHNLIRLLDDDGFIYLEHYPKEGEYTGYFGLHQWNFYLQDEHLFLSNQSGEAFNLNECFSMIARIENTLKNGKIQTIIRKKQPK